MRIRVRALGFSLLEVLVSLAILGLALTAIAGINATAFEDSNYAKWITTATLLARSKMIDVEEKLRKDGFGSDDREYNGTFEEDGYPDMRWVATCRQVELDIGQLVGGLFGGDVTSDKLPEQMQKFLGAMQGQGPADLKDKVSGSDISKLMGGGGLEVIYKQIGDTLGKSIREVNLEVFWGKKGINEESIKFVEYVTTNGRLTIPQGGGTAPASSTANNPASNPSNPASTSAAPGSSGGALPGLNGILPGGLNLGTGH